MDKKIVLLSGPSGVGKTPLIKSFQKTHPYASIARPVLWTSRTARPGELDGRDYFFRSEADILALPDERFIIAKTSYLLQAIDLDETEQLFKAFDFIIYKAHPLLFRSFIEHPKIIELNVKVLGVFMQPASLDEIGNIKRLLGDASWVDAAASIMSPKLLSRAQQRGIDLDAEALDAIRICAEAAWDEINIGQTFDHIIINHDGEECANWLETPPRGEAGKTLREFVKVLNS